MAARRSNKPISRGFGTRSVIASIESQLGGKAEFDWRSEGLICRLTVPLARDAPAREAGHPERGREQPHRRAGAKDGLAIMRRRISG